MPRLTPPAFDPETVKVLSGSTLYPPVLAARVAGRSRRALGDAAGLTQFGVNLVDLAAGAESALRHWHTHEDELVYVLTGELTMITDEGEQVLTAGMFAGFPAGRANGHHFVNRSSAPARYLVVGTRVEVDTAHYPDDDLMWLKVDGREVPGHKDGTPY